MNNMAEFDFMEIDELEPYKVVPFGRFKFMFVISYEDNQLPMFLFFTYDSADRTCQLMNAAFRDGILKSDFYRKESCNVIGEIV